MPVTDPISLYTECLRDYLFAVEDSICDSRLEQARKIQAFRRWLLSLNMDPDLPSGFKPK